MWVDDILERHLDDHSLGENRLQLAARDSIRLSYIARVFKYFPRHGNGTFRIIIFKIITISKCTQLVTMWKKAQPIINKMYFTCKPQL